MIETNTAVLTVGATLEFSTYRTAMCMLLHLTVYDVHTTPVAYNRTVSITAFKAVGSALSQGPLPLAPTPVIKAVNRHLANSLRN